MNMAQLTAALRNILIFLAPVLVQSGWLPVGHENDFVLAATGAIAIALAFFENRPKTIADRLSSVAPDAVIIASPALAAATRSENVLSSETTQATPR